MILAPWTVEAIDGGFKVVDANKQSIAMSTVTPTGAMLKLLRGSRLMKLDA